MTPVLTRDKPKQTIGPHVFWITGLPAAGKSTLAQALSQQLQQWGVAHLCLDGDELRRGLCADLGLTDADRRENVRRAGAVAALAFKAGQVVICALVSPFADSRQRVRALFPAASFTEVYLSTSLAECCRRDPKGLYAQAKAGQLHGLTGWDAPYDVPEQPEFNFDSQGLPLESMLAALIERLV